MEMEIAVGKPVSAKEKKGFEDYEVKEALQTLLKAEEIKQDSELMALVEKERQKKEKAIRSIAGLRAASKSLGSEPEEQEEEVE